MQEEKILDKWNYITYNFSDYILKIYLKNFNDLYVHVGGCAPKCGCLKRPAGLGQPEAAVTGSCGPPNVDSGS